MKKTLALLTIMSAITTTPALAVDAGVPFNGSVLATCTIDVTNSGSMASINNATVLSSKSGSAGLATITTTGHNFEASVANPPAANFTQTSGTGYTPGDATLVADMTVLGGASSGNYAAASAARPPYPPGGTGSPGRRARDGCRPRRAPSASATG